MTEDDADNAPCVHPDGSVRCRLCGDYCFTVLKDTQVCRDCIHEELRHDPYIDHGFDPREHEKA